MSKSAFCGDEVNGVCVAGACIQCLVVASRFFCAAASARTHPPSLSQGGQCEQKQQCAVSTSKKLPQRRINVDGRPLFGLGLSGHVHAPHPYGSLGPGLDLYEDTGSSPQGRWHLPSHVQDQGTGFLMGR